MTMVGIEVIQDRACHDKGSIWSQVCCLMLALALGRQSRRINTGLRLVWLTLQILGELQQGVVSEKQNYGNNDKKEPTARGNHHPRNTTPKEHNTQGNHYPRNPSPKEITTQGNHHPRKPPSKETTTQGTQHSRYLPSKETITQGTYHPRKPPPKEHTTQGTQDPRNPLSKLLLPYYVLSSCTYYTTCKWEQKWFFAQSQNFLILLILMFQEEPYISRDASVPRNKLLKAVNYRIVQYIG